MQQVLAAAAIKEQLPEDFQQFGAHIVEGNQWEMAQLLCGEKNPIQHLSREGKLPMIIRSSNVNTAPIAYEGLAREGKRDLCGARMPVCQLVYKRQEKRANERVLAAALARIPRSGRQDIIIGSHPEARN